MKTIYIAGKVTGLPYEEAEAKFYVKTCQLVQMGHEVVNPMRLVSHLDIDTEPWDCIMKACIREMLLCDEVHLLPCWQESRGAVLERDIAVRLGMPIIYPS